MLGVVLGLILTIPLTRLLASFLFGVQPWDWQAYTGALFIVLAVATLAPIGPAFRAAGTEPIHALRR